MTEARTAEDLIEAGWRETPTGLFYHGKRRITVEQALRLENERRKENG